MHIIIYHLSILFGLDGFPYGFLVAQAPSQWGWPMHPMWGWGWGVGMMAMMLFFFAVVMLVGVTGIRWFIGQTKQPRPDSAMETLRERFARGEIDKDEFEAKKQELS